MYQSYLDGVPIEYVLNSTTNLNVQQAYKVWAIAARNVWLNIFAPNNREQSILRPSLLANNFDSLNIEYSGITLL